MNFYVCRRLLGPFSSIRPAIVWILAILLTFSLLLATIAYYRFGAATYPIYYIATGWFGVLWLLFCCLVVFEPLRLLLRTVPSAYWSIAIITVVSIVAGYAAIHAAGFRVVRHQMAAPVDLRLVQLSDLHLGSTRPEYARKVVAAVNDLKPDAVVITGDVLDSVHSVSIDGLQELKKLEAPVFCVTGNHENYAGLDQAVTVLRRAGFTVLRTQSVRFSGVHIIGLDDDPRPSTVSKRLKLINIEPEQFNILLYHRPEGFKDAAAAGIDLMLAGHTHGGQIFPFSAVIRLRFDYPSGMYRHGQSTLHTTQGTGTWGPRMRLGTTSEIVVLDLRKEQQ